MLFIVFLCFCIWFAGEQSKDNKGFFVLLICLSLGLASLAVYYGFLTRKQMKMEENKSSGTKVETEKLDKRIKAIGFVVDHAWVIGIAAIVLYFVVC